MSDPPLTAPGVYVEGGPTAERMIQDAPMSVTAFIGRAERGPVNEPVPIRSVADYDRLFGGLWSASTVSHSVRHFFDNGGSDAIVVRVHNGATAATYEFPGPSGAVVLEAANPGAWANNLEVKIDHETTLGDEAAFNLTIYEIVDGETVAEEVFRDLSVVAQDSRHVGYVLEYESEMLRVRGEVPKSRPDAGGPAKQISGGDGGNIGHLQVAGPELEQRNEGLWALDKVELFNLLCIPPFSSDTDVDADTWTSAQKYCGDNCAFLIVDSPSTWISPPDVVSGKELAGAVPPRSCNAAVYFPRVRIANPLNGGNVEAFAPCGVVAGIYARTDRNRGVWNAPAGNEAALLGVEGLACELTDDENDILNSLGVNCIRSFDDARCVLWGSRTTAGTDQDGSEWKYVAVRRLALFMMQSIRRYTAWALFAPVTDRLLEEIRSHIGSFMARLFRQGVFAGAMPDDSYFVNCDLDTTEEEANSGIKVEIGFAPYHSARFVTIIFNLDRY